MWILGCVQSPLFLNQTLLFLTELRMLALLLAFYLLMGSFSCCLFWFLTMCLINYLIVLICWILFFIFLYCAIFRWSLDILRMSCLLPKWLMLGGHHMIIPSIFFIAIFCVGHSLLGLFWTALFCNLNVWIRCAIIWIIIIFILNDFTVRLLSTPVCSVLAFLRNRFIFVFLHFIFFTYNTWDVNLFFLVFIFH